MKQCKVIMRQYCYFKLRCVQSKILPKQAIPMEIYIHCDREKILETAEIKQIFVNLYKKILTSLTFYTGATDLIQEKGDYRNIVRKCVIN